jgi:hypothetical protein
MLTDVKGLCDVTNQLPSTCEDASKGAWWHNTCHFVNLNGTYVTAANVTGRHHMTWRAWKQSFKGNSDDDDKI